MEQMVNVFVMGKKYEVPASLTIMKALEYAGYKLVRGCGCRNGFCGACATIYRIKGDRELHTCLACSTQVVDGMYITQLPFFPLIKEIYDINEVRPDETVMMKNYPEIYSCFPRLSLLEFPLDVVQPAVLDEMRPGLVEAERHVVFHALPPQVEYPGVVAGTGMRSRFPAGGDFLDTAPEPL